MTGMSGIQTLREIKRKCPLVEVIMLTGHANVEVAIEGMELGAFDYLMKPVDIHDLPYKVQDALKKKSLQEGRIRREEESSTVQLRGRSARAGGLSAVAFAPPLTAMLGGKEAYPPSFYTPPTFLVSTIIGLCAGLITGAIGAGGGFILTPPRLGAGGEGVVGVVIYSLLDFLRLRKVGNQVGAHHGESPHGAEAASDKASMPARLQASKIPPLITFDEDLVPGGKKIPALFEAPCGLVGGFVAAIMGVGGGFLTFPMFVYILGVSSFTTVGTDVLKIIFTAGLAAISQT